MVTRQILCETCGKRPACRSSAGHRLCGRCGRPDGKPLVVYPADHIFAEIIASDRAWLPELAKLVEDAERRAGMTDAEIMEELDGE